MATDTISISISGDTPTGVTLRTLTDASSGADVSVAAGLTLPAAFTGSGANWSISFTDTGAAAYNYAYRLAWSDGSTNDESGTIYGTTVAVAGADATSADMDDWYGPENITVWSDLSNTKSRDGTRISRALAYARDEVATFFSNGPYLINSGPYAAGSSVFGYLDTASRSKVVKWQTVIAASWLVGRRWLGVENNSDSAGPSATVNSDIGTVTEEMRGYRVGQTMRLNVTPENATSPTGPTVIPESSGGACWPCII